MQVVCAAAAAVVVLFQGCSMNASPSSVPNIFKLREWDLWLLCVSCGCCVCPMVAVCVLWLLCVSCGCISGCPACHEAADWHILVAMEAVWRTYTMMCVVCENLVKLNKR